MLTGPNIMGDGALLFTLMRPSLFLYYSHISSGKGQMLGAIFLRATLADSAYCSRFRRRNKPVAGRITDGCAL